MTAKTTKKRADGARSKPGKGRAGSRRKYSPAAAPAIAAVVTQGYGTRKPEGPIAFILGMLRRPAGASIEELTKALLKRFPDKDRRSTAKANAYFHATRKEKTAGTATRFFIDPPKGQK